MKTYKFSTQLTVMDMFRFQMRHTYICVSGFIAVLVSLLCLVILWLNHDDYVFTTNGLLVFGGALFTVIQPFMLLKRSFKIIALTPTFKEPLNYELDEEGVHVSQNGETADFNWDMVVKVIETKTTLCIYSSPKNAFILPVKQLGEEYGQIKEFVKENVKDYAVVKVK